MSVARTVTPEQVDNLVGETTYFRHKLLTICVIELTNGFTVTGEASCVHADNYDEQIGGELAFARAKEKIWQLEGYVLKELLHREAELINQEIGEIGETDG